MAERRVNECNVDDNNIFSVVLWGLFPQARLAKHEDVNGGELRAMPTHSSAGRICNRIRHMTTSSVLLRSQLEDSHVRTLISPVPLLNTHSQDLLYRTVQVLVAALYVDACN